MELQLACQSSVKTQSSYNNKRRALCRWGVFWFVFGFAQPSFSSERPAYSQIAEIVIRQGMSEQYAYSFLRKLTAIGPRLTGSPQAAAAVELVRQEMQDLGFESVHLEPTTVGRWVRGEAEEARLISSLVGVVPLSVSALGGSLATPEDGISAPVLEVKSFEELEAKSDRAKGKIIFFNRAMDPSLLDTFQAYGQAAEQRVQGAVEAAKAGGVAALVRSLALGEDDFPHTGLMKYDPRVAEIPAASVSTRDAAILSEALRKDPNLIVHLKMSCATLAPVISYNVVGQITGTEKPAEIILLGAHLDSWDLGAGAHDDGAGCSHVVEAIHLVKSAGLKPKRTIRGVLFMDEEFGGTGGRDYARSELRKTEKHLAAVESDRGGFLPVGLGVAGEAALKRVQSWSDIFKPLGVHWIKPGGGGVDIAPLAESGAILMGLVPDSQRYYDAHHCSQDILAAVHPRELELGAIVLAILSYLLAEEGI
ncbi:MAG: M28 family peptidase [Acidobacteriota bacterium]